MKQRQAKIRVSAASVRCRSDDQKITPGITLT